MRFGCLFVPDLPLQALLRVEPDLHGRPVAVAQGEGASARVVAVSVPARTQGVLPGARLKEALALCPDLVLRWDDEAVREAAREAALDAAAAVSPRVEEVAPGLVLVDARGLGKLHGGDRGLASALLAAARRVGLEGKAGVASTIHRSPVAGSTIPRLTGRRRRRPSSHAAGSLIPACG